MGNLIGSILGEATGTESMDQILCANAIGAASASAMAYLNACVAATTPEVKRLYADYLTQTLAGQQPLTELALNKGWIHPYDSPQEQLTIAYHKAQEAVTAGDHQ